MSATAFQLPYWVWDGYVVAVCVAALCLGGRSERVGAAAILGGWIASVLVTIPGGWEPANLLVAVDIAVLLALVGLALRSHRYWPILAAAFQLLAIITHWAHSLDRTLSGWAYMTAGIIWGYLLVGALALGTWNAWRERAYPATSEDPATDPGATRR
jgi:hypothetical protein